jgi:hypothetical protein
VVLHSILPLLLTTFENNIPLLRALRLNLFFEDTFLQVIQIIILLVVDYDYEALWIDDMLCCCIDIDMCY